MIYILIAVFITGTVWGFAALSSLPASGFLMLALGSGVVILGAVAWAMVAVHMLDVGIALRDENKTFLKRFAEALRPSMFDLVVASVVTTTVLLLYYYLRIPINFVGLSAAPTYAVAVKWVLCVRTQKHTLAVNRRARTLISLVYLVLAALTSYLLARAESAQLQGWANAWVLVTTGSVAAACYLSAANFRSSILHGQILRSLTVELLRRKIEMPVASPRAGAKPGVKGPKITPPSNPNGFGASRNGGGRKKSRKR